MDSLPPQMCNTEGSPTAQTAVAKSCGTETTPQAAQLYLHPHANILRQLAPQWGCLEGLPLRLAWCAPALFPELDTEHTGNSLLSSWRLGSWPDPVPLLSASALPGGKLVRLPHITCQLMSVLPGQSAHQSPACVNRSELGCEGMTWRQSQCECESCWQLSGRGARGCLHCPQHVPPAPSVPGIPSLLSALPLASGWPWASCSG